MTSRRVRNEGGRCRRHGKTDAELAAPYAAFAFSLPVIALLALILVAIFS